MTLTIEFVFNVYSPYVIKLNCHLVFNCSEQPITSIIVWQNAQQVVVNNPSTVLNTSDVGNLISIKENICIDRAQS